MQRLIWKDARSMGSLMVATLLAILGFNFLVCLTDRMARPSQTTLELLTLLVWLILPMVVAMGAAPVLVGGEEESGSLAWLRSLPIAWHRIVTSKLLVAIGSFALALCAASLCAAIASLLLGLTWNHSGAAGRAEQRILVTVIAVATLGLGVLLTSFATAFWFRSPITALIVVIPVLVGLLLAFGQANASVSRRLAPTSEAAQLGLTALLAAVALGVLLAAVYAISRRRLRLPETQRLRNPAQLIAPAGYRPPRVTLAAPLEALPFVGRPSPTRALLWSVFQPIRWHLLGLMVTVVFFSFATAIVPAGFEGLCLLACYCGLVLIGALTFYPDAVGDRCRFLYERGISPTRVWATRLLVTGTCMLVTAIAAVPALLLTEAPQQAFFGGGGFVVMACTLVAAFSVLQLISQWSPRPALTFFAGPIALNMMALFASILFSFYFRAYPVLLLSAAILLFASWRLMPYWMNRRTREFRYALPMLTAIGLAALLPYGVVLTTRYLTAPQSRAPWRKELASVALPNAAANEHKVAILSDAAVRNFPSLYNGAWIDAEGREERIRAELNATDAIGDHTSMRELLQVICPLETYQMPIPMGQAFPKEVLIQPKFPSAESPIQLDAIRVLLKWSRITREHAIDGRADFHALLHVAEQADWLATKAIQAYVQSFGVTEPIREVIEQLPSQELVDRSRRFALIRSWKRFQNFQGRIAGTYSRPPRQTWLAVERYRAERFVDEVVHLMLSELNDLTMFTPADAMRLDYLESEAYLEPATPFSSYWKEPSLSEWMQRMHDSDERLQRLRQSIGERSVGVRADRSAVKADEGRHA